MSDWGISRALRKCFKCLAPTNHWLNVGYDYYHYVCAFVKWPQMRREKTHAETFDFTLSTSPMALPSGSSPLGNTLILRMHPGSEGQKSEGEWLPGGPVVETPSCQCRGCGFNPWLGNKDSHMPCGTAKKKKKKKSGGKLGLLHFYQVFPQFKPESGVVDI